MCNQEQALQDALQIELTAGNGAFLINDDAIQAMSCLPAKSVDLICVDLPYGTTANKWDIIIPFDKLWLQLNRIAKDNAFNDVPVCLAYPGPSIPIKITCIQHIEQ